MIAENREALPPLPNTNPLDQRPDTIGESVVAVASCLRCSYLPGRSSQQLDEAKIGAFFLSDFIKQPHSSLDL